MTAAISAAAAIAVGATAAIGAGATIYAADKGASATTNASNNAIAAQRQALTQQEQIAQPYVNQGQAGIDTYNALTSATPGQAQQTLQNTPGYQATLQTGTEAAERAAAASGLNLSGNQLTGVQQYGSQLADSTYQQAIDNALNQEQIGQAAAAGTAANIGTAASNIGNIGIAQGQTQAGIVANEVAGITRAGSNATNQYLTYQTLNNLQNPASSGSGSGTYPAWSSPGINFDGSGGGIATYGVPNFDGSTTPP